jgi:hypothetical protein
METTGDESSATASIDTASSISRPSSTSSVPTSESLNSLPTGAPVSPIFEVRHTPTAGRAVFATQHIPKDTVIWRANDLALSVLLREYRREVCGQCFGYEHGRDLDIRDKSVGFAFCCTECQDKWRSENGELGVQAWTAVEKLVKGRGKEDSEMVDVDQQRPKSKEIEKAWDAVEAQAELIRTAREVDATTTKQHRKALQAALLTPISPDVMSFCVSGLIRHHNHPANWANFLAIAADTTPYHSSDDLRAFTRTYLHLLATLPLALLPLVTHDFLFTLSSRDSHNSFGIRSLEDDGSEFFGYGCWPAASYFNHSCAPNAEKRRSGRVWEFRAARDIEAGEQLCITYLSGEERKLSREKRMLTLRKNWGFECGCERCAAL